MPKRPLILLVMHTVPLESGFLATKFIMLARNENVHMLVWDTAQNVRRFVVQNRLDVTTAARIHVGATNIPDALASVLQIATLARSNKQVSKYLKSGGDDIRTRLKHIAYYLPLLQLKPDIVHFEFGTLANDIALLKQLTGCKTVVSFRGYDINYIGLNDPQYYSPVWQHADAIHFLGEQIKSRAVKRGYKSNKTEAIIPPAIDTKFFDGLRSTGEHQVICIASVGRLTWKKGYEYALLALAEMKKMGYSFRYLIAGEGPHRQALEFMISELGLHDSVELAGRKTPADVKTLLATSDLFLHPAVSEGFCNAVLEAQAMQVPVVCSDADGLSENIEDGITGFVTPKWDIAALTGKLVWCIENKEQLPTMGIAGRVRVISNFQLEDQLNAFRRLYKQLHEQ